MGITIGAILEEIQGLYQQHHQPCFLYLSSEVIKVKCCLNNQFSVKYNILSGKYFLDCRYLALILPVRITSKTLLSHCLRAPFVFLRISRSSLPDLTQQMIVSCQRQGASVTVLSYSSLQQYFLLQLILQPLGSQCSIGKLHRKSHKLPDLRQ